MSEVPEIDVNGNGNNTAGRDLNLTFVSILGWIIKGVTPRFLAGAASCFGALYALGYLSSETKACVAEITKLHEHAKANPSLAALDSIAAVPVQMRFSEAEHLVWPVVLFCALLGVSFILLMFHAMYEDAKNKAPEYSRKIKSDKGYRNRAISMPFIVVAALFAYLKLHAIHAPTLIPEAVVMTILIAGGFLSVLVFKVKDEAVQPSAISEEK